MADHLLPLPSQPFTLIPNFTAQRPETLHFKERDTWKWKQNSYSVSRLTSEGKPGDPYIQIIGESRKETRIQAADGREIMRILKENPLLKGPVYHGMSVEGSELWTLKIKSGFLKEKWDLIVHDASLSDRTIEVSKIDKMNAKMGILIDGHPAVAMGQKEFWSHAHREDVVSIAPGMDIVLAIAVNWVKIDLENDAVGASG